MKSYKKVVTLYLLFALIASVMLPAGILCIILANSNTWILIGGIVMTAFGFYGTPVLWIKYGESKRTALVQRLVYSENIYTVEDIASHASLTKEDVTASINKLIAGWYLTGFIFRDGKLILNTNKKQTEETSEMRKCPACGGTMRYNGLNYVCEYCGHVETKK